MIRTLFRWHCVHMHMFPRFPECIGIAPQTSERKPEPRSTTVKVLGALGTVGLGFVAPRPTAQKPHALSHATVDARVQSANITTGPGQVL